MLCTRDKHFAIWSIVTILGDDRLEQMSIPGLVNRKKKTTKKKSTVYREVDRTDDYNVDIFILVKEI